MPSSISNTDDIIDSRDVIERIEELEAEIEVLKEGEETTRKELADHIGNEVLTNLYTTAMVAVTDWELENNGELAALKALADEGEICDDWEHGVGLIHDSYFTDYARELLEDCGTIPKDLPSWVVLDWEATAENVKMDYTSVEFDGVTYWVR